MILHHDAIIDLGSTCGNKMGGKGTFFFVDSYIIVLS